MKKKKLIKKLQSCKADKKVLLEELEKYSYSIERKKTLTHDERVEMLLAEAESAMKSYRERGTVTDCYVAQMRLFAQKYRDTKAELELLQEHHNKIVKEMMEEVK